MAFYFGESEEAQSGLDALDEALKVFDAVELIAEKADKKKGVDGMIASRRAKGWAGGGGNPWHHGGEAGPPHQKGKDAVGGGQFSTRAQAKSASTDQGGGPKYRDDMGTNESPKPGKKVAHDCGRYARSKGRNQRCQDKTP